MRLAAYYKPLSIFLRLFVTASLLWLLASRFDFEHALEMVGRVSPVLLAVALMAMVASVLVTAVRWQMILAAEGPPPPLGSLTRLLFIGLFFNQVLPTGVGGDAVRAWRCYRLGIPLGAAVRSVLLDRASGFIVMVAIYAASLPALLRALPDPGAQASIVAVLGVALAGLLALPLFSFPAGSADAPARARRARRSVACCPTTYR